MDEAAFNRALRRLGVFGPQCDDPDLLPYTIRRGGRGTPISIQPTHKMSPAERADLIDQIREQFGQPDEED